MGILSRPEKRLRELAEPISEQKADESLRDRVRALKEITALYRLERLTYLGFAVAAFIMVLVVALTQEGHASTLWGAFGASGIIAASCSRIIVMWDKAVAIILQKKRGG
jgi:hypothetical protein